MILRYDRIAMELPPPSDPRKDDQDRADEKHDHDRGHDANAGGRRLFGMAVDGPMEAPGAAEHPVDMRADRAGSHTGYQQKRGDAGAP